MSEKEEIVADREIEIPGMEDVAIEPETNVVVMNPDNNQNEVGRQKELTDGVRKQQIDLEGIGTSEIHNLSDTNVARVGESRTDITDKSEFVETRETEPVDKAGWIVRRISELGGYENVSDYVKTDVFGFDIADISGSRNYIKEHETELPAHRFNMNVDLAGQLVGGTVVGVTGDASICNMITYMAHETGIGMSTKNQIWGSDSNTFAWKGIPAMTLNRDGFGMHTRHDTIALLSDWSLERSAILLGYIADRLGNIEIFPFERKVPEEFIRQLDEYFG